MLHGGGGGKLQEHLLVAMDWDVEILQSSACALHTLITQRGIHSMALGAGSGLRNAGRTPDEIKCFGRRLVVLRIVFLFLARHTEKAKVKMQGFILSMGASLGSGKFISLVLTATPRPDQDSSCYQSVPIYITNLWPYNSREKPLKICFQLWE